MTIEEAITHAKEQAEIFGGTHGKFLDMAIAALEKQIPKKLDVWADGTEYCPNCEHDNSCLGFKVCVNCGQALNWSEVEE